jgi:hypothetical protein
VSLDIDNKEQQQHQLQHQQKNLPQQVKPDLFSTQSIIEATNSLMAKSSRVFDKLAQEYLNARQEESQLPVFTDNTPSNITEDELDELMADIWIPGKTARPTGVTRHRSRGPNG